MRSKSRIATLAVSCAIFFAIGILGAGLGPALPSLAFNTGSTLDQVGTLFTALFVGALTSQIAGGFLTDRFGQRIVLQVSLILFVIGLLGVALTPSLPLALLSMFVAGLGDGVIIIAVNVGISQLFAVRGVAALNILNVFFGLGAVTGPAIAAFGLQTWGTAVTVLWATILVLLPPALLISRLSFAPHNILPNQSQDTPDKPSRLYKSPFLWALGALLMLYVGYEVGTGNWAAIYIERSTNLTLESAALIASGFWLALAGGRVIAAVIGTWLKPETVLLVALFGSLLGGLLTLLGRGDATLTVAALLLLGFSLGPVFPTIIAITTLTFKSAPGRATGVIVAMGSLGGTLMPWLQGVLLVHLGPHAYAIYVAAGPFALLVAFFVARALRTES